MNQLRQLAIKTDPSGVVTEVAIDGKPATNIKHIELRLDAVAMNQAGLVYAAEADVTMYGPDIAFDGVAYITEHGICANCKQPIEEKV